ncbi:MAG: nucleoside hydrolase [Anaerolineae bacterium]|nr:nucleoside hydrolase [Anaerolineae bacterium]
MKRLIIDSDTGSDDAVALVMALKYPDTKVEAITVGFGNVPMEQGVQNAIYTVELCGADVPVYAGLDRPLIREGRTGQYVHGEDGMGDIGLPLSGKKPAPGHAVDVLIDTINRYAGDITLVTLGPLMNVAVALLRDPSIAHKVNDCVIMGGVGYGYGNVTPVAEYNIWADPEAAQIVFQSGMPLTMVGIDVNNKSAVFTEADSAALRGIGTPLAEFCVDIQAKLINYVSERTGIRSFSLPDPITMGVALDPFMATEVKNLFVNVELGDGYTRGQTVVDHLHVTGKAPNTKVVLDASREGFITMLHNAVR